MTITSFQSKWMLLNTVSTTLQDYILNEITRNQIKFCFLVREEIWTTQEKKKKKLFE